jgi:hypothetical protein
MRQTIPVRSILLMVRKATNPLQRVCRPQKASRTKNPIADIKPASKAMSSIASIQRMDGIFFMALICFDEPLSHFEAAIRTAAKEERQPPRIYSHFHNRIGQPRRHQL